MRSQTILAIFLLCVCDNAVDAVLPASDVESGEAGSGELQPMLASLELEAKTALEGHAQDRRAYRELESQAQRAMEIVLLDPESAQFRGLRRGKNGAICGQVNGKNSFGAYVGFKDFVIDGVGETVNISRYSDRLESETYTLFAASYLEACASRTEANRYTARTTYSYPPSYPARSYSSYDSGEDIPADVGGWSEGVRDSRYDRGSYSEYGNTAGEEAAADAARNARAVRRPRYHNDPCMDNDRSDSARCADAAVEAAVDAATAALEAADAKSAE